MAINNFRVCNFILHAGHGLSEDAATTTIALTTESLTTRTAPARGARTRGVPSLRPHTAARYWRPDPRGLGFVVAGKAIRGTKLCTTRCDGAEALGPKARGPLQGPDPWKWPGSATEGALGALCEASLRARTLLGSPRRSLRLLRVLRVRLALADRRRLIGGAGPYKGPLQRAAPR